MLLTDTGKLPCFTCSLMNDGLQMSKINEDKRL